jgi:hypothetical protein
MDNIPSASPELTESIRQLLEDRKVGNYAIPTGPFGHKSHVNLAALALAATTPLVVGLGGPGVGKSYSFRERFRYTDLELLDPDEGLPEWQKRRNQSQRAKQALVSKLKGKRK